MGLRQAIWTTSPVGDLGFVYLISPVVQGGETGRGARGAVDIDQTSADSTNQVMVVVADAILEASRRACGLNATEKAFGDEHAEGVVHRLQRNGADPGSHRIGHRVGRNVGLA